MKRCYMMGTPPELVPYSMVFIRMLAATYTNDVSYVVSSLTTSPTTSLTFSLGTRPFTGGGRVCARCYI